MQLLPAKAVRVHPRTVNHFLQRLLQQIQPHGRRRKGVRKPFPSLNFTKPHPYSEYNVVFFHFPLKSPDRIIKTGDIFRCIMKGIYM
jgi:hypothetical protein